jgi:hypothetical protein
MPIGNKHCYIRSVKSIGNEDLKLIGVDELGSFYELAYLFTTNKYSLDYKHSNT